MTTEQCCLNLSGKDGYDWWFRIFFASSSWVRYWYYRWSKWNQGEFFNFLMINHKFWEAWNNSEWLIFCIFQRTVASSNRRSAIRFSDLKHRRYWFPLMVSSCKFYYFFSSFSDINEHDLLKIPIACRSELDYLFFNSWAESMVFSFIPVTFSNLQVSKS